MKASNKLDRLKQIIASYESCVVAFSGGQDSAFLLKICSLVLPSDKILAVTAVSETYPESELAKAKILAKRIGVGLKIIRTSELKDRRFADNPPKRCYFCKKELFSRLKRIARDQGYKFVLEAGNLTDEKDYRPGNIAKKELGIESPLVRAGFDKKEIQNFSRKLALPSWDKPSLACLASRVPYGTKITADLLKRIDRAEAYLAGLGLRQVRLRHYDSLCRIEAEKKDLDRVLNNREKIIKRLKKLGYNYITLDLEGYRTGSLNEILKNKF